MAHVAATGVALLLIGVALAGPASARTAAETCRDQVALIKAQEPLLEREFYGETQPADYDGGLDERYNRRFLRWGVRTDAYARWVYKSDRSRRAVSLRRVERAVTRVIKTSEATEEAYMAEIFRINNVARDVDGTACADPDHQNVVGELYATLKTRRAELNRLRTTVTLASRSVDAELRAVRRKLDVLRARGLITKK